MLRWILIDMQTNETIGEYATLMQAVSEGNKRRLATEANYFVEDRMYDEELSWTDIVWSKD